MRLAGKDVLPYLSFPPLTDFVRHAGFSRPVFAGLTLFCGLCCLPVIVRILRGAGPEAPPPPAARFPWWGWAGLLLTGVSWLLAWNRFPWFKPLQAHTFLPLWLGFILTVNGLSFRRTGRCLLTSQTRPFLLLFPISTVFWWFFEYLNRFVQNWHYLGVDFSAGQYILHASLSFSTVLPAVAGVMEWTSSFARLTRPLEKFYPVRPPPPTASWLLLAGASTGLTAMSIWPDLLYPLVWTAPFLIITGLQAVSHEKTFLAPLGRGDWRPAVIPALAALICGLFWEMWNFKSMAHWEYSVPFVDRFHLFKMPILGYAGYLPFGLECAAVMHLCGISPETGRPVPGPHAGGE